MNASFLNARFGILRACLVVVGVLGGMVAPAHAGELKLVSPKEIAPVLNALAPRIEPMIGTTLVVDVAPSGAFSRRLTEPFDIAIVDGATANILIEQGKVPAGTLACLGWTGLGIAVRPGAAAPKIATADEVRDTLLAARSIAFTGAEPSGRDFRSILWQLGIPNQVEPKLIDTGNRRPVKAVAKGRAELAIAFQMEIAAAPGVQTAGVLPPELQHFLAFYVAPSSEAKEPAAALRLVAFLTSGEGQRAMRAVGLDMAIAD